MECPQSPCRRDGGGGGPGFEITKLASGAQQAAAAQVLADAMLENPLHVRAFGTKPTRRRQRLGRFMEPLVRHVQSHGTLLGAYAQGELIGVLGMMQPGCCRPKGWTALRFAAVIVATNSPLGVWRIVRWLAAWARSDPSGPHWHIGPLAVASAYRRQGVGRHLMMHCCAKLDTLATVAWLETDLAINARFYTSLGFVTAQQEPVLGVPNWFMRRVPVRHGGMPLGVRGKPLGCNRQESAYR